MATREEQKTRIQVTAFFFLLAAIGGLYAYINETATKQSAELSEVKVKLATVSEQVANVRQILESRTIAKNDSALERGLFVLFDGVKEIRDADDIGSETGLQDDGVLANDGRPGNQSAPD